ncbi:salicylate 1-monooxygenase [Actinomadura spongiicola]|uniref:Salicylate 1-monooxygenase n=1 Tax=Actinomadura spongiicola TaxID=2303421 RepID=A0A372GFP5_9ACTN|nr:FAD-dependent monooxygenase [Actinomadura spongiicola]RFS84206.1 salicylate 1-monooxygenase [Actinomadura spongiicola]
MAQLTVAVAGAGIAGLTLAAALCRNGIDCHVYEQAERLAEVGAGVQVAPNATRLLRRLGLADRLSAVAVAPEAIEARRWDDGALLRRTPLGDLCRRRFGAPYYTLHRADLHDALLSLVPPDRVHLGARGVAVTQDAGAARLRMADGAEIAADLVVGADGIHSVVREHLVTDRPRYSGHTIYRGLVPAEKVPHLVAEPRVRLWFGPERHCVCYPVSSGEQVSFGATVPASDWREESWSARGDVADLAAAYRGWHADVAELIGAAETVGRWALHDRESIDRLGAGRVAVIGDAAHPMLPFQAQGANQAVEDAVVLALCLFGVDPEGGLDALGAALRRYERIRLPRTTRIQRQSRDSVKTFHQAHGDAETRRDTARDSSVLDDHRWLFEYDAEQAAMTSGS